MNKKIVTTARVFLGLVFTVFGLNGFLQFMPMPEMPQSAQAFMGALMEAGYFLPVLKTVETLSGILLLANLFVPLVLVVLAPIVLNITLFHLFLAPSGLILPVLLIAAGVYLAVAYRHVYQPLFQAKPQPQTSGRAKSSQVKGAQPAGSH